VLTINNEVNEAGIAYYNNLINALAAKGIESMITIYHWDLPQYLQDLGGWTNPAMVKYFEFYADLLYKSFGDRVKEWITFNEPATFCDLGYGSGGHAPQIETDLDIGAYLCSHHILLAHAAAYRLYKARYFEEQQGMVGICLNAGYSFPANENVTMETVDRAIEFFVSLDFYRNFSHF
jgi:beta-glucosidase/6-phospho-beta-glucosidase/beta-galactosidase